MPSDKITLITVCDTCRVDRTAPPPADGSPSDGARLAELVAARAAGHTGLQVRRQSCLMGCERGCNVAIQARGKLTYVLGRFTPQKDAAAGIVEYAALHAQSTSGQVPFRQWPTAIKGHFVARIPPLPGEAGEEGAA